MQGVSAYLHVQKLGEEHLEFRVVDEFTEHLPCHVRVVVGKLLDLLNVEIGPEDSRVLLDYLREFHSFVYLKWERFSLDKKSFHFG